MFCIKLFLKIPLNLKVFSCEIFNRFYQERDIINACSYWLVRLLQLYIFRQVILWKVCQIVVPLPASNYMLKDRNRNTRSRCEICSRRHWHRSSVFIVNFEHISHLVLVFLLLTLSR